MLNPGGIAEMIAPQEGETVAIAGTLRPAEIEQEYGLQPELEAEFEGEPAFVADEVYPSAR
ncbi:MAG: hypothetical protein ACFBSF_18050 [Leptolyngbyaceae cyanobacterium]